MNEVKVFKMINGEEIIGEVLKENADYLEIKSPAQIILQRTDKGMGVAIAPYMPYSDGNINLYNGAIASDCKPDQNLINEYNKIFGSGIQIAPASLLATL